ncbi:SurA N-terminal domain-containing protein [Kitasatospora sp. NPDC057223]|uniref:SurA N-terminal domain-containing protein n=1 Tax=Kitasatospora sp. NPDC057223 TaxID=3346055 RepID=UPI0036272703
MNRRTALAGVLLCPAVLLTSCGGAVQPGAAALVGGERISLATVQARAAGLRTAAAGPSGDAGTGAGADADGLARRALSELVRDALVARALADRGLRVTAGEVAGARAADQAAAGGAAQLARVLARRGVPAEGIDTYYRQQAGIRRLAAAQGLDAGTEAGDAAVRRALADAALALHVRVSPRYGRWDVQQVALLPDPPGGTALVR